MKKTFLALIAVCVLCLSGCGNKTTNQGNDNSGNGKTNNGTNQDVVEPLTVEQTAVVYNKEDGISRIDFTISNNTDKEYHVSKVELIFSIDGVQNKLVSIVEDTLLPGDVISLSNTTEADLTNIGVSFNVVK